MSSVAAADPPVRSIVPVLASVFAVTVVALLMPLLPISSTPLLDNVVPMVTLVPPAPVASTVTVPLLVKPAVIASVTPGAAIAKVAAESLTVIESTAAMAAVTETM